MLRQQGEIRDGAGIQSAFDIADALPVESDQLCEAFLCQARFETRGADVTADNAKY